jgi:hypothetical protein
MSLHPDSSTWPLTVDAAVDRLLSKMHPYDQLLLQKTAEKDLIQFHMGWGMGIRHEFGLWRDNTQLLDACGTDEPDSASMSIIETVWRRLQSVPTILAEPTVEHPARQRYDVIMPAM